MPIEAINFHMIFMKEIRSKINNLSPWLPTIKSKIGSHQFRAGMALEVEVEALKIAILGKSTKIRTSLEQISTLQGT